MPSLPESFIDAAHVFTPAIGYVRWQTGGGCEAYVRELLDNHGIRVAHILVTDLNGMLPIDASAGLIVGVYPDHEDDAGEGIAGYYGQSLETATLFVDAFVACHEGSLLEDFDAAVRLIQEAVGQTDGGVAAMHFCEDPDEGVEWEGFWQDQDEYTRFVILLGYLRTEWAYHESAKVMRDPRNRDGWYIDEDAEVAEGLVRNHETGEDHAAAFVMGFQPQEEVETLEIGEVPPHHAILLLPEEKRGFGISYELLRDLLDAALTHQESLAPEVIGHDERALNGLLADLRAAMPPRPA